MEHVAEGCGIRQTGRLCRVDTATVARYSRLAGTHAHLVHNDKVGLSPLTTELQFDEMWAFVGKKKEANCDRSDPDDDHKGDYGDHVAFDHGHRLVLDVVPGARTIENTKLLVANARRRTGGRLMNLMTSDDYPAYETAILHAYGETTTPPPTGKPGRPRGSVRKVPEGLTYAVVEKVREKGRVVRIGSRVVFGTLAAVALALGMSGVSRAINTAFLERENGTARHRNARKARKSYRFSKDGQFHEAVTYFTMDSHNFCWVVRTLRTKDDQGHWQARSPALAAGLADHLWSMAEWLSYPVVQR